MFQAFFQEYRSFSGFCQTSVLSLKTWIWLCFTSVTTRTRTRRTRTSAFGSSEKNAAKRNRQHARIQWMDTQRGGGRTHNVTQRTDTHIFTEGGGTHPQCIPTNGHTYFHRGGTHPQCNPTNGHTNFFWHTKLTN